MTEKSFITVVAGLPRSGTSLMMQMLAAGGMPVLTDQIRSADEDNPRGYLEFEAVKQTKTSPAWLNQARGKAVKMVHLLLLDLPGSGYAFRVLLMKRRIAEVLASQRTMLQRHGKGGANLSEAQLGHIFSTQMAKVENWLQQQPNFTFLSIDYNELLANPTPQIEAIDQFLDVSLDKTAMNQAIDPSLYRQRS